MANAEHVAWLTEALRSGRFQQGTGHLTEHPGEPADPEGALEP